MRNHQVTRKQKLLRADGSLAEPGWAKQLVMEYSRGDIKAPKFRIKEWDYYLVLNEDYACAFTISDDGYIGLQSVSLLNFKEGWEHTETILNPFPMGKLKLPATSETGDTVYEDKRLQLRYEVAPGQRRITCHFENFWQGKPVDCQITLHQPPMDTIVIATPWKEKKTAFYYNQKINCMRAEGSMTSLTAEHIPLNLTGISAPLTGGVGYGPTITAGTGAPETELWKESPLDSILDMGSVIPPLHRKICCFMTVSVTSLMM